MSIVGFATYLTSDSNYSLHGSKQELLRCLTTTQHRWGAKMHVAHHVGHQSIGNYPFAWFACCTLSIVVMWCASRILMIQIHISNHIQSYPYVCRWNEWNGKPLPGADRNSGSPLRRWSYRHTGAHSARSDKAYGRGSEICANGRGL